MGSREIDTHPFSHPSHGGQDASPEDFGQDTIALHQ